MTARRGDLASTRLFPHWRGGEAGGRVRVRNGPRNCRICVSRRDVGLFTPTLLRVHSEQACRAPPACGPGRRRGGSGPRRDESESPKVGVGVSSAGGQSARKENRALPEPALHLLAPGSGVHRTDPDTHVHMPTHTCTHTYMCPCAHTHTVPKQARARTSACTQRHRHTHTHICTDTHTHDCAGNTIVPVPSASSCLQGLFPSLGGSPSATCPKPREARPLWVVTVSASCAGIRRPTSGRPQGSPS